MWDVDHHAEAVHAALTAATGRHLHPVRTQPDTDAASHAARLDIGDGYDVALPDLGIYGDGGRS